MIDYDRDTGLTTVLNSADAAYQKFKEIVSEMFDAGEDRFVDYDFGPSCDGDSGAQCLYYYPDRVPSGCPAN